jgi:hypothetical protein
MATIDLGRLGFVNKGTYNNSTTYEKNDLVQFTDGGILSTYLYIDSTAQSGQAPSSSGTAGSRWVFFAKGVADAVASAGNNKILVTDGSGNLSPLAIGSASQVLKVNSGANGFEFGSDDGGTIKSLNYTIYGTQQIVGGVTNNNSKFTNLAVNVTPQSASSKFLISATINGETFDSPWDYVFNFIRTVGGSDTDLGSTLHTTSSSGYKGIACTPTSYAASSSNNDSTPEGTTFQVVDAPNTTSAITYVPTFIGNGSNFALNRCVAVNNENFVSTMYVMEF